MPTADMHGGEVSFKDREGNEVGFEMVRIGTSKEFDTVKLALAEAKKNHEAVAQNYKDCLASKDGLREKLATADAAYTAEKEKVKQLGEQLADRRDELTAAQDASAALGGQLSDANEERGRLNGLLESARTGHEAAKAARQAALDANASLTSELEDLMTVKASLEETNTALDVSEKELCESRENVAGMRTRMLAFCEQEQTGLEALVTFLKMLTGE